MSGMCKYTRTYNEGVRMNEQMFRLITAHREIWIVICCARCIVVDAIGREASVYTVHTCCRVVECRGETVSAPKKESCIQCKVLRAKFKRQQ